MSFNPFSLSLITTLNSLILLLLYNRPYIRLSLLLFVNIFIRLSLYLINMMNINITSLKDSEWKIYLYIVSFSIYIPHIYYLYNIYYIYNIIKYDDNSRLTLSLFFVLSIVHQILNIRHFFSCLFTSFSTKKLNETFTNNKSINNNCYYL